MFLAVGCGGGGCGGCAGMEPIPGGFPSAQRHPNAAQIRVTPTALSKITADPAGIIGPLAGGGAMNGVIEFPIASCPDICCANNQPIPNCGPVQINLNKVGNEPDRLALTPVSVNANEARLDVTVRARIKTVNDLQVTFQGQHCTIDLDTTRDNTPPDLLITTQILLQQDATTGTTKITASNTQVSQLDSGDYSLGGDILCTLGGVLIPASFIQDQLEGPIEDAINGATCKSCDSVADCSSPFATACTGGECKLSSGACLQELGLNGRLRGSGIFASLSPGTTGALDIYEVAGGYSIATNSGLSLGMLGGMLPGGAPRDKCGPPATAPTPVSIPRSTVFQGNQFNAQNFDVAFGLHKSQLADLAYAGYDGGLFCLTIGSSTVAQLSTSTISLLSRSLGKLVETNSPMAIGLRPQSPPTIVLGKNTFKDDGSGNMVVDQPLLDISFQALEIDFFASIDEQYNRVFTVVTDVHLPIGLQTTTSGELTPVIGNPDDAFTNVSVKNSDAIAESPEEIAGLFPTLLGLVLPQLSGGLSPISLPALGGLALSVKAVTSVDNDEFLGIFADLVPAPMARTVDTTAEVASIEEPPLAIARDVTKWRGAKPAAVTLALGGSERDLEFSYRIDGGSWSGWSRATRQVVSSRVFWLPGVHKLEVRSRQIGNPDTLDPEPVLLELPLGTGEPLHTGTPVARTVGFHGQAGASGCSCDSGGSANGALFALVIGLILVPWRRVKRALRLGPAMWSAVIALLPGCSCGSDPCGSMECLPGEVEHTTGGRWTSIASDDKRVMVATYEQLLGDLVVVDATDPGNLKYTVADGIPEGVTPTFSPDTYRGGVADAGPNVGAFTSIAIGGGTARVAYQDREEGSLKYAYETKTGGSWKSYVVDSGDAESGIYASMVIDADKKPAIAYIALGIDDGMGHRNTELRIARATKTDPSSAGDWQSALIATAPGSCAGLCGSDSCVEPMTAGDPSVCVSVSSDCTTACDAMTEVCSAGMCRTKIDEPEILTPPSGTGLYVSLVVLPDGRLAAAYYDSNRRALVLSAETAKGASTFNETVLDGNVTGADRGMWSTAVVGDDGTVHIAYQDALGDQLMYTTWNGSPGTPAVVDDGQRNGDRTHPVGAGASIFLNGGAPAIAYQDGLVSDVYVATTSGGTWTTTPIAQGPLVEGFSIAATRGPGGSPTIAWGSLDPNAAPPQGLVVKKQ
ncbi:MAG: hypothetical protein HOV81_08800 [Kofleriaceae bacterium]|nr:hypothetical protein [Kofleriaceae bacterium]